MKRIMVTGGAGFIGSHFIKYLLARYDYHIVNYDALKYAGNLANLAEVAEDPRYTFVHGDICDLEAVTRTIREHRIDTIVNFAAETHVDRSLLDPGSFITTDVYGTFVLLEAARLHGIDRYIQVSTDEVYGEVPSGYSTEQSPIQPRSPYAASKASGDLMVQAYVQSHGLPAIITRGSNNFGSHQYPEKFIPLFITNAIDDQPLPLYGDGRQIRDWIYVLDHCAAIDIVLHRGVPGEVYNIGGGNERQNIEIALSILRHLGKPVSLIRYVKDRPGHDRRYALDCTKLRALGWSPQHDFETALAETVRWYAEHQWWWRKIKSGEYWEYYRRQYEHRLNSVT